MASDLQLRRATDTVLPTNRYELRKPRAIPGSTRHHRAATPARRPPRRRAAEAEVKAVLEAAKADTEAVVRAGAEAKANAAEGGEEQASRGL